MFDRLTLHIGHNKTGSTSIQETMHESASHLAAHGVFYFEHPRGYRFLEQVFKAEGEADDISKAAWKQFRAAAKRSTLPHCLVSAETLVRLDDAEVAALVAAMRELARTVDVLIYVRHPVPMASSAAQQAVKSGVPLARILRSRGSFRSGS